MPGFLLLEDAQKQIGDRLGEFGQGLFGQFQPPAPPEPTEQAVTLQPDNDVVQRLTDTGMQALNAPAEAGQRLADFGMNLLGQGLSAIQPEPSPTPAPTPAPSMPEDVTRPTPQPAQQAPVERGGDLRAYARQAAQQAGIDPDVYERQIQQESGFNPNARSPAGATGVAQFMPGTARGMGIDPTDPYASLDAGARLMRSNLDKYGGDYSKALAAYNAGPGNVDKYGGVPPFAETQTYIRNILGGAQKIAEPFVEGAKAVTGAVAGTVRDISQFGDKQLTSEEAYAACGPAAAVRFAQRLGRNPTLREALDMAKTVGWTAGQGMAGLSSEKALMDKMGVETQLVSGPQWDRFAREAQTGNPVTISTSAHYFYADGYNPDTGQFHVGRSGTDLRGGKEWMTRDEIVGAAQRLGGGEVQGALMANNPVAPSNSTTTGMTMGPMQPGFTAPGGEPAPAPPEERVEAIGEGMSTVREGQLTVLDDVIDRAGRGDTSLGRPFSDLGTAVSGMLEPARRAYTPSEENVELIEGVGRGILQSPLTPWGAAETMGRVGPALEESGFTAPGGPLDTAREQIANAPVLGGALGMARGPLLLSDQELLEQATPAEIETARRGAQLTNPNPSEQEIVDVLRGLRTGEAAAMAEAGPGAGPVAAAGRAARRAGGIDYDALAQLRRQAAEATPPGTPAAEGPNFADRALAFTVNNMLSNPASLLANAAGGLMETAKRPIVTATTAGVEAITGNLPGARTQLSAADADLRAMGLAVGDALADAATTFGTGRRLSRAADQPEAFEGAAGVVATPFLRAMGATDEFISGLNSAGAQAAELVRLQRAHPELTQAQVMSQFQDEILTAGQHGAAEAIFQTGGSGVGESLAGARRLLTASGATPGERIRGAAAQVLVPFSAVPDVILTRGAKRVPIVNELLTAGEAIAAARRGDPLAAKRAAASGALAAATNYAIYTQVREGNITGSGPDDPAKKRALMQARDANGNPMWRPNSIKVGDQWIPYSSLGGVAIQIGAIANAVEAYDEAGKQVNPDMAKAFGTALGDTITDAWYLQTLAGVFQAVKNGQLPEWMGTQALSTAGRAIPEAAFLNTVKKLTDPTAREAEPKLAEPGTWLEYFQARTPLSAGLELGPLEIPAVKPRLDPATGRPIEEPQTIPSVLTRGTAPGQPNLVNEVLLRHNLGVGDAPKTISPAQGLTIAIDDDEQRRFIELAGPEVEQRVLAMQRNASFQRAPIEQQRELLQEVIGDGREVAAIKLFQSLPKAEQTRRLREYEEARRRQAEPAVRLPAG